MMNDQSSELMESFEVETKENKLKPWNYYANLSQRVWNDAADSWRTYFKLFRYVLENKFLLILATVFMSVTALSQVLIPKICGDLIDSVMKQNDPKQLNKSIAIFLFLSTIYSFSEFFWGYLFNLLLIKLATRLRSATFQSLVWKDMRYHDNTKTGDMLTMLDSDIEKMKPICTRSYASMGRNLIQLIGSVVLLLRISLDLTICLLILLIPFFIINIIYNNISKKLSERIHKCHILSASSATESFLNIKLVKSFCAETKEIRTYEKQLTNIDRESNKLDIAWSIEMAVVGFLSNCSLLAVLYMGLGQVGKNEITPGDLSSFLLYTAAIGSGIKDISSSIGGVVRDLPICKRILGVLETPRKDQSLKKDIKEIQTISFEDVTFFYGREQDRGALNSVSFDIHQGDTVGIIGQNGSGKSSALALIQSFYTAQRGAVKFNGIDMQDIREESLRKQISIVIQESPLFSGTIEDNIAYGVEHYTEEELNRVALLAKLDFVYNPKNFPLGFKTEIGERGAQLSGGQRQRIGLARALLKKCSVLILDEAFSAVDSATEAELLVLVAQYCKDNKITRIVVSHRKNEIQTCDRLILLEKGKLIDQGTYQELTSKGLI